MNLKRCLGSLLVLLSPCLMAADGINTQSKMKLRKSESTNSLNQRIGKSYSLNASALGVTHNALARSFEVGYFLDSSTLISLQFNDLQSGVGTADDSRYSDDELKTWERNGKGSSLSVGAKSFFGNSFYAKAEGYYRNQDHINKTGSKRDNNGKGDWIVTEKETGRIEDLGITAKIGNQWQWSHFTLGCDWIGVNGSLYTLSERGVIQEDDRHSVNLLNFYMGASF